MNQPTRYILNNETRDIAINAFRSMDCNERDLYILLYTTRMTPTTR